MIPRSVLAIAASLLLAPLAQATQAIANWDAVPYQALTEPTNIGVVAFHEDGVDVHFKINGEAVGVAQEPTLNPQTNVWEYWIAVDPAKYPDGPITLQAEVVPGGEGNESRQLELPLFANSGKTLGSTQTIWMAPDADEAAADGSEAKPFGSFKAAAEAAGDGGTIYLKKGDYQLNSFGLKSPEHWLTITAAPGLSPEDVSILAYGKDKTSTGRYGADLIRWKNVTVYADREEGWGTIIYVNKGQRVWFDHAVLTDKNGRFGNTTVANNQGGEIYLTDTHVHDVANVQVNFQRNCLYENILADIFRGGNNLTAININIITMDKGDTEAHPDFIQFHNPKTEVENVILYNVSAYDMMAQGFFGGGGVKDVAFVNILLEKDPPDVAFLSQIGGIEHLLIWNVTIVDQSFNLRGAETIEELYAQNNAFASFSSSVYDKPSFHIDHVHASRKVWNQKELMGTNATTGDLIFVNYDEDDYRQAPESPAYASGKLPPGVPADIDGVPYDAAAPNRGAFAKDNPGKRRQLFKQDR